MLILRQLSIGAARFLLFIPFNIPRNFHLGTTALKFLVTDRVHDLACRSYKSVQHRGPQFLGKIIEAPGCGFPEEKLGGLRQGRHAEEARPDGRRLRAHQRIATLASGVPVS